MPKLSVILGKMFFAKDKSKNLFNTPLTQVGVFPSKNALCICGSGKRYKNCCEKEEKKPFVPIEKGIKIVPDNTLYFLKDSQDQKLLSKCVGGINHFRTESVIPSLASLNKKYPKEKCLPFLLALAYKFNHDLPTFQSLIKSFKQKEDAFLPMKLLRWWHVYEWGLMPDIFGNQKVKALTEIALSRKSFYLTEFFLWGLIRILEALYLGKIIEAEGHFLSMNKAAEKINSKHHWALKEGASILEAGYFSRRVKILEMEY